MTKLFPGGKDEYILYDDGDRRLVVSAKDRSVDQEFVKVPISVEPFFKYERVRCGCDSKRVDVQPEGTEGDAGVC